MMGSRARQLLMGVRCAMRVELERDALLPGETLLGVVVLDVGKPMDGAALKVRVRGRQTLHWTTSSGDAMVAHAQTKEHLFEETVLADEGTSFGVGEWRYPFAFELPEDVQHDFEHKCSCVQELEGVRVSVHHEVEATLDLRGVGIFNLTDKRAFRVNALPVAVPFGRRVGVAREDTVNFLAMFQRGSCHVRMDLDTDVFDTTSTIKALVTLDLKTSKSLKHVVLLLYEDVYVDCHNPLFPGRKQGSRSVRFRRVDRAEIESAEIEGNVTRLRMELPINADGSTKKETALNPTMSSLFINVRYRVAVEVKFSMAPRIRVHAPVTILPRLVAPHELEITPVVALPVAEPIPTTIFVKMLRQTHTPELGKSCEQLPPVGRLTLKLSAPSYTPGETLHGRVRLSLDKPVGDAMVTVHARAWQSLRWVTVAEGTAVGKLERVHKHVDTESFLGDHLNGALAIGTHEFPFSVDLPDDLIPNASVEHVSRRNIEKIVRGWTELTYDVTAKLEVAGLSNPELQQRVLFEIVAPTFEELPIAKPIAVERTQQIKFPGLGGENAPCTLRLSLPSDRVTLPDGPIVATVELDLPANRKLHNVHLVLYEDVSIALDCGSRRMSRPVCSRSYKAKQLARADGNDASAVVTVRGTLELPIANPDEASFGVLVPAFDAAFMHIHHRVRVECSFVMATSVTIAAPIELVGPST